MAFADWIPTIINVGSSLFGGGGSSAPSTPSSSGLDWGSILQGVGQLASRVEMVPGAGALDEDIRKANRFNLLAGLLGGGAQLAGGQMQAARKAGMLKDVSDILSGKQTTTGQAIEPAFAGTSATPTATAEAMAPTLQTPQSTSAALYGLIDKYPGYAPEIIKMAGDAQADQIKRMDIARKAMTGGLREVDLYNIAESRGILPEDRAAWVENEKQKRAQGGLSSLGLMGVKLPQQSAIAEFTQPTTPPPAQNPVAQDILRKADKGQEFDITVPPDQAESVMKGLEQGGYKEEPVTARPNFLTPEEQRGAKRRQQRETQETQRQEVKDVGEWYDRNKQPFVEIRQQSVNAPRTYDIIVSQLMSNDPSVQQNGLTALLSARDESVVQIGELDRFNETVYTPLEKLNRQAQALLGKRVPLPESIRNALIKSARDVRDIKKQAGRAADVSIMKAARANAKGNFDISGISEYDTNYKSIRDWLDEKNQDTNNSIMSIPSTVETAPTQSYRPRRIMKIEPLG